MTTIPAQPAGAPVRPVSLEVRDLLLVPALAGAALSLADLLVMTHVSFPWAILANTSAVWAVGAFALGMAQRTDPARAAVAGTVMMLVAVESYYMFAALADLAGYASMWSGHARSWMVFGVAAGVVFGVAGSWAATGTWWQRSLGCATAGGVLVGEALHTFVNAAAHAHSRYHYDLISSAGLAAAIGILIVVASARSTSVLAGAAALLLPVSVFFALAFGAVGIAY